MTEISRTNNSIYLAKEDSKGLVTVVVTKLTEGLVEITYFGYGVTKIIKSGVLLAGRMIAGLTGIDYADVNKALRGVA